MQIEEAKNQEVRMLVDTGAEVSVINKACVKDDIALKESEVHLVALSGGTIKTLGEIEATFPVGDQKIKHPLYIMEDGTLTDHQGILGIDFLKKHEAGIQYKTREVTIKGKHWKTLQKKNVVTVPPRTQTLVEVEVDSNKEGIIEKQDLGDGVFSGECLVKPKQGKSIACVVNLSNKARTVKLPYIQLTEIQSDSTAEVHSAAAAFRATVSKEPLTTRVNRVL